MDKQKRTLDTIRLLRTLTSKLPNTVREASEQDVIYTAFQNVLESNDPSEGWEIVNRRMDILFGQQERDANGKLKNIMRGKFGMDLVLEYLERAAKSGCIIWDAIQPRLARIASDMQDYW
ncbi:hypothetical protein PQX77_009610 [Marasmius sp. AFHP31]|nr:hypothetical protein PQX77_009610 [Marasmius sp. AFHP31]